MAIYKATINISLRKGILDVQGKTVEQALHAINLPQISEVHIGKYVELHVTASSLDEAKAHVTTACDKLIANPIMEDYTITISETNH